LCRRYGDKVYTLNGEDYFDFPTLEKFTSLNVEDELRKLGFGYRAKYIVQTAKYICENFPDGNIWLYTLRNLDYKEAHAALLKLSGVRINNSFIRLMLFPVIINANLILLGWT
jgi:N-glycosylase/DNA lyase